MAKNHISDHDTTAVNNTDIINAQVGVDSPMSALNNAHGNQSKILADFYDDIGGSRTATGTADAIIVAGATQTLAAGQPLVFIASDDNTGATTLNWNGLGIKSVKKVVAGSVVALAATDIKNAAYTHVIYDGTQFLLVNSGSIIDALENVVEDTTPQSGGAYSANSFAMMFAKGADVASATELLVLTDGNYFDVTGTTAITSIETTADAFDIGSEITLHFDGVLTLTHHATNLILPSGNNITTTAGDEAKFIKYATGDWRCVSYLYTNKMTGFGKLLSSTSISADATLEFTGMGAGSHYCLVLRDVRPATDDVDLMLRTSNDDGSTYASGASDYSRMTNGVRSDTGAAIISSNTGEDAIRVHGTTGVGNATNEGVNVIIHFWDVNNATKRPRISWDLEYSTAAGDARFISGWGRRKDNVDVDAAQLLFSSGNIASGTIDFYEVA